MITMVTATEGAVIYYTEDGSTPTASSKVYSGAVTYNSDKTVKAIAVKSGMEDSPVSSVSVNVKTKTVTNIVYINAVPSGTYTVYHFQQKTTGGKSFADYSPTDTDDLITVVNSSTIDDLRKEYTGFTAKAMVQNETAIYIFYDRDIITYTFETGSEGKFNDGTTERVITGLYGAFVSVPIPSSNTNEFGGWFTSTNNPLPIAFEETDNIFSVKWIPKEIGGYNWYETPVDAETGNTATETSTYIYFGVFPNTVLSSDSVVSIDENEIKIMGENTYYKGNDGAWYAKVTENCCSSTGYTYSDGTTVKRSKDSSIRYFKVEPIKWKVLTQNYNGTGNALLMAEEIITANVPYYTGTSNRTIGGNTVYRNNYKYSTIRAYLNGKYESDDTQSKVAFSEKGFLQTAFSEGAQVLISTTVVDNSNESTTDTECKILKAREYSCENTADKVFLLSQNEVTKADYGFASYTSYGKDSGRIYTATDYAKANFSYVDTNTDHGGCWWLRSPDYDSSEIACGVDDYGEGYCGNSDYPFVGIVPALTISLY